MTKKKNAKKSLLAFALCLLTVGAGTFPALLQNPLLPAFAETVILDYSATAIEDDLSDIDVTQYPADAEGEAQVIRFQEYCYSEKPFFSDAYGLYIYVYNPTQSSIRASMCKVNMAVEYDASGEPTRFENVDLTFLDEAYNYRFLKFCISNPNDFFSRAQTQMSATQERRYDVAGVNLYYTDGTTKDVKCAQTYTWTGYAKGLGEDDAEESTLFCKPLETLDFNVKHTYFRPGIEGEGVTSEKSLHSVYFSIPNERLEEYGELIAVTATYLNATLKPVLVNGDTESYEAIKYFLGVDCSAHREDLNYQVAANLQKADVVGWDHQADYAFNYKEDVAYYQKEDISTFNAYDVKDEEACSILYLMLKAENGNADEYDVSSQTLKEAMLATGNNATTTIEGAEGTYNADIFESVASTYTTKTLTKDDEFTLTADISVKDEWWEKVFNMPGDTETMTIFSGVSAIYEVKDTDLTGDASLDCANLKIAESDYADFCDEYNRAKNENETLFLYRYEISDYESKEASIMKQLDSVAGAPYLGKECWYLYSTNAYFFQQTVNLDFDVISVSMADEDGTTILAVVSDPVDFIPDATHPNDTTEDNGNAYGGAHKSGCAGCNVDFPWWGWLVLIAVVLAFILIKPILSAGMAVVKAVWTGIKWLFIGLWYIIASPYYLIRWIVRGKKGDD